jgi:formate/nitrite transporter FocA (FNT family)
MSQPERRRDASPPEHTGTRLSAAEIHDNVLIDAEKELERPAPALFWSALDAGMVIGFSFAAGAFLSTVVAEPFRAAAAAAAYPLGFILVVLARSQLFTENTLEPVIPLLNRRNRKTLVGMLRLWAIVMAGNLLGAAVFALAAAHTPMLGAQLRPALLHVAESGTSGGFGLVVYKGIFAGWLVGLMAWLIGSTSATGAQIALVWLTTAPIAAFDFRHSIAGAVEAFYRAAVGATTWGGSLGEFVVPAIVGNVIGGVTLVALLNFGQVSRRA